MNQKKSVWIWYPEDMEVWLHMQVSMRRTERGVIMPPFWRMDSHYQSVKFRKRINLEKAEKVTLHTEGSYNVVIDGKMIYDLQNLTIPAGEHELVVSVYNPTCVPAIIISGETLVTDTTWEVNCNNDKWLEADSWGFSDVNQLPSEFKLETTEIMSTHIERIQDAIFVDFGKQTFGYLKLNKISGSGKVLICYGDSKEEALSEEFCETLDHVNLDGKGEYDFVLPASKAFRYICIKGCTGIEIGSVSALYEYLPLQYKGKFSCSNERLNEIWDISVYTLHLNTREFFLDGIKRDRWVWSGDAYQSFLMNYYIFFDSDVTCRTLIALRGKDPVETHINQIMDYSFYWFMGIYDYYMYSGDLEFVRKSYPKMTSLMEFCLNRTNNNGMMEGLSGDWVFVDWADMEKDGELCFEQLLLCRSLEIMSMFSEALKEHNKAKEFSDKCLELKNKVFEFFWDESKGALLHSRFNGQIRDRITQYPNVFALLFGYLDETQTKTIKANVLLNENVQKIKTPYMKFYELAALCEIDEHEQVIKKILDYWGGMLDLGATTFWEEYDPSQSGADLYAMYDRPFGKSLCHAWGASPIYLFGRYYLGVKPLSPCYETYVVEPKLGGLKWVEGVVPTANGNIEVYMDGKTIRIKGANAGTGVLRFRSGRAPEVSDCNLVKIDELCYELTIKPKYTYEIKYQLI
jgi:alpha-L-rhamnosidase